MKKNPIHFYWGRKNGLVVTREDAEKDRCHPPGRTVPVLAHQPPGAPHHPPPSPKRKLSRSLYENSQYRIQLR